MKRFNAVRKHTYTTRDGQEKTTWKRIGSVILFPASAGKKESGILELDMFGESYNLFLQEPKDQSQQQSTDPLEEARDVFYGGDTRKDEISIGEIPF